MTDPNVPLEKTDKKVIAVFDFDKTLIEGDSLWPYLKEVVGVFPLFYGLGRAVLDGVLTSDKGADSKSFMKERLLQRLLAGQHRDKLSWAIPIVKAWMREKSTLKRLHAHYEAGHHVVIASGSLDLYLPELLKDIPHHALICTEIGVRGSLCTGRMVKGNCVRRRKAERVAAYMREHGPFDESWGYGNYPDDMPMLELMQHRVIV